MVADYTKQSRFFKKAVLQTILPVFERRDKSAQKLQAYEKAMQTEGADDALKDEYEALKQAFKIEQQNCRDIIQTLNDVIAQKESKDGETKEVIAFLKNEAQKIQEQAQADSQAYEQQLQQIQADYEEQTKRLEACEVRHKKAQERAALDETKRSMTRAETAEKALAAAKEEVVIIQNELDKVDNLYNQAQQELRDLKDLTQKVYDSEVKAFNLEAENKSLRVSHTRWKESAEKNEKELKESNEKVKQCNEQLIKEKKQNSKPAAQAQTDDLEKLQQRLDLLKFPTVPKGFREPADNAMAKVRQDAINEAEKWCEETVKHVRKELQSIIDDLRQLQATAEGDCNKRIEEVRKQLIDEGNIMIQQEKTLREAAEKARAELMTQCNVPSDCNERIEDLIREGNVLIQKETVLRQAAEKSRDEETVLREAAEKSRDEETVLREAAEKSRDELMTQCNVMDMTVQQALKEEQEARQRSEATCTRMLEEWQRVLQEERRRALELEERIKGMANNAVEKVVFDQLQEALRQEQEARRREGKNLAAMVDELRQASNDCYRRLADNDLVWQERVNQWYESAKKGLDELLAKARTEENEKCNRLMEQGLQQEQQARQTCEQQLELTRQGADATINANQALLREQKARLETCNNELERTKQNAEENNKQSQALLRKQQGELEASLSKAQDLERQLQQCLAKAGLDGNQQREQQLNDELQKLKGAMQDTRVELDDCRKILKLCNDTKEGITTARKKRKAVASPQIEQAIAAVANDASKQQENLETDTLANEGAMEINEDDTAPLLPDDATGEGLNEDAIEMNDDDTTQLLPNNNRNGRPPQRETALKSKNLLRELINTKQVGRTSHRKRRSSKRKPY